MKITTEWNGLFVTINGTNWPLVRSVFSLHLLDVCYPDYFQGCRQNHILLAVPCYKSNRIGEVKSRIFEAFQDWEIGEINDEIDNVQLFLAVENFFRDRKDTEQFYKLEEEPDDLDQIYFYFALTRDNT